MMYYLFLCCDLLLAIFLGCLIIPKILVISYKKELFDMPDSRKVHKVPIPRLGGVSFFPAILISVCFMMGVRYFTGYTLVNIDIEQTLCQFFFLAAGGMLLYLVGLADDLIGVGYRYKFMAQIVAALLLVWPGEWINSLGGLFGVYEIPAFIGIPLTLLIVVYITNAINLIDGIDGLASGLCCIALTVLGILHVIEGEYIYAMLAFSTLGVVIPFWFYNVFGNANKGHKLFMGDTGSLTLGYILSALVIHMSVVEPSENIKAGNPDMIVAFSTLLVPLFDVVRVVLHRIREGKNPFLPDQNHFHHKLLRTGMRVRSVMITILCVSLFFIGFNYLLADRMDTTLLLVLDVTIWTAMQLGINYAIRQNKGRGRRLWNIKQEKTI